MNKLYDSVLKYIMFIWDRVQNGFIPIELVPHLVHTDNFDILLKYLEELEDYESCMILRDLKLAINNEIEKSSTL